MIKEVLRYDDLFVEGYSSITLYEVTEIVCYTRRIVTNKYESIVHTITFNMKTELFQKGITSIDFYKQLVNQPEDIQSQFALKQEIKNDKNLSGDTEESVIRGIAKLLNIDDIQCVKNNVPVYNR